ncbi:unnamed protein product, partial [Prorocentrum cordatum]
GGLYVSPPRTGMPEIKTGLLVELLEAVYGLGDALVQWLSSFTNYVKEIGFQCSMFDGRVLYLIDWKGLHGIMGLAVDDVVGGGDGQFEETCQKLRRRSPFGAGRHNKCKYTGKELVQNEGGAELAASLSRGPPAIQLTNIATERRRATKEFCGVALQMKRTPLRGLASFALDDAAWASAGDGTSQAGRVFAASQKIPRGEAAIISIQLWTSHKLKKNVFTSLVRRQAWRATSAAIDVAIVRSALHRSQFYLRWMEGASQPADPLANRSGGGALLRRALDLGEYGITSDCAVLHPRAGPQTEKGATSFACAAECCFTGLGPDEMDCAGGGEQVFEDDDQNGELEANRRFT